MSNTVWGILRPQQVSQYPFVASYARLISLKWESTVHERETNGLIITSGSYLKVRENYSSRRFERLRSVARGNFRNREYLYQTTFRIYLPKPSAKLRTILQTLQPALIHDSWQFTSRKLHSPQAIYSRTSVDSYPFALFLPLYLSSSLSVLLPPLLLVCAQIMPHFAISSVVILSLLSSLHVLTPTTTLVVK